MPFTNYNNRHFSETEKTEINLALKNVEAGLADKLASLSAEERQQ